MIKKAWQIFIGSLCICLSGFSQDHKSLITEKHTDEIIGLDSSPDGKSLLTTSKDGSVKVWDIKRKVLLRDILECADNGFVARFINNGKNIIILSNRNRIQILNASNEKENSRLWTKEGGMYQYENAESERFIYQNFELSPDRRFLFAVRWRNTGGVIWDLTLKKIVFEIPETFEYLTGGFFSPNNKILYVYGQRNGFMKWDLAEKVQKYVPKIYFDYSRPNFKISQSGKKILSVSSSSNVIEMVDNDLAASFEAKKSSTITNAELSRDENKIFLINSEGEFQIWDLSPYGKKRPILSRSFDKKINSFFIDPAEKNLILTTFDGRVIRWNNFQTDTIITTQNIGRQINNTFSTASNDLVLSLEGNDFMYVGKQNQINNIVLDKKALPVNDLNSDPIHQFDYALSNNIIAFSKSPSRGKSFIQVWNLEEGRMLFTYPGYSSSFKLSNDGSLIYSGGGIYNTQNGQLISKIPIDREEPVTIKFSQDNKKIASWPGGLWDVQSGQLIMSFGKSRVASWSVSNKDFLSFSPDNTKFSFFRTDNSVVVHDLITNKELFHLDEVSYSEFSPDNKYLLVIKDKYHLELINPINGEPFATPERWKKEPIVFATFSKDAKTIIVFTSYDIKIWDAQDYTIQKQYFVPGKANFFKNLPKCYNNFLIENQKTRLLITDLSNELKDSTFFYVSNATDFIVSNNYGYHFGNGESVRKMNFLVQDSLLVPFDQLDVRYNRPDKILTNLSSSNSALIDAYNAAYNKRIKKLGIDPALFQNNYNIPQADFNNRDLIKSEQTTNALSVNIKAVGKDYSLDRFNVWVNEVPVFGMKGINIRRHNSNNFDTTITITLSQGENRIETSVLNGNGIESYRVPLFVKYTPAQPKKENFYFIGIGIDRFADASHNLQYCSKDIRNLAVRLKEKYGDDLRVDTLFNESVTVERVKDIKQKLLQSKEDDKVIIAYSGHGLLSKDYDYYLSTYNVNFNEPEKNGLPYEELENLADGIRARKKLMLIDACHSGELDKEEMQKIAQVQTELSKEKKGVVINGSRGVKLPSKNKLGTRSSFELMQQLFVNVSRGTGATIISAAAGTQFALERGDLRNGVFTYSILELLKPGKTVTVGELKKHVGSRVSELTKGLQQPTTRNETNTVDWEVWGSLTTDLSEPTNSKPIIQQGKADNKTDTKKPDNNNKTQNLPTSKEGNNSTTKVPVEIKKNGGADVPAQVSTGLPSIEKKSISNFQLIASYPLSVNGFDPKSNSNPEIKTDSIEFRDRAAFTSGRYQKTTIDCRRLNDMDLKSLKVNLTFKLDTLTPMPVLMLGTSCRHIGFYITGEGKIRFVGENGKISQLTGEICKVGVWYNATIMYDNSTAELLLDGKRIASTPLSIPSIPACSADKSISSADYSRGAAFRGYWKNLEVFRGVK